MAEVEMVDAVELEALDLGLPGAVNNYKLKIGISLKLCPQLGEWP